MMPRTQLVEAALFAANRPITIEELQTLEPEASLAVVRTALDELREHYDFDGHAVEVVELAGGYQVLTRRAFAEAIERAQIAVRTPRLTASAMETLAVIAYRQPVGRAEIEEIRGVWAGGVSAEGMSAAGVSTGSFGLTGEIFDVALPQVSPIRHGGIEINAAWGSNTLNG